MTCCVSSGTFKPYAPTVCVLWQMVSKRDRMTYEKIADLFSENNNRQRLREYMNSTKLPVIPYLGNWLYDDLW